MRVFYPYQYFFYSVYIFCKSKLGGNREMPQVWAVSMLCYFVSFILLSIDIELKKHGVKTISQLDGLPFLPEFMKHIWPLVIIVFLNFWYFFVGRKWEDLVSEFDQISNQKKIVGHAMSVVFVVVLFVLHIFQILTFPES